MAVSYRGEGIISLLLLVVVVVVVVAVVVAIIITITIIVIVVKLLLLLLLIIIIIKPKLIASDLWRARVGALTKTPPEGEMGKYTLSSY